MIFTLSLSCPHLGMLYLIITPQAQQEGLVIFWVNGDYIGTHEQNRVKQSENLHQFIIIGTGPWALSWTWPGLSLTIRLLWYAFSIRHQTHEQHLRTTLIIDLLINFANDMYLNNYLESYRHKESPTCTYTRGPPIPVRDWSLEPLFGTWGLIPRSCFLSIRIDPSGHKLRSGDQCNNSLALIHLLQGSIP